MATALRAQSQCRTMIKTLVVLRGASSAVERRAKAEEKKNSDDRNIETANPPT